MDALAPGKLFSGIKKATKVVIVSNRQPWFHERVAEGIRAFRPASGLVTALEPITVTVTMRLTDAFPFDFPVRQSV
jgi:trehalose 6-phosphate synthase